MTWSSALLGAHLSCAAAATVAFWSGALARKGGPIHRAAGRWFARFVYVTASTGALLALLHLVFPAWYASTANPLTAAGERQTMWLVLYVLVIIVAPVQHGVAVVAAAGNPLRVRSRAHISLSLAAIAGSLAMVPAALLWERWLFLVVAPIGFVVGLRDLAYASRRSAARRDWEREHLTSQLTGGITLHTALLVFGTSRTLGMTFTGLAALWPWTLPALVGLPVILWLRAKRA